MRYGWTASPCPKRAPVAHVALLEPVLLDAFAMNHTCRSMGSSWLANTSAALRTRSATREWRPSCRYNSAKMLKCVRLAAAGYAARNSSRTAAAFVTSCHI